MSGIVDVDTYGLRVVLSVEETAAFLGLNIKTVYASIDERGLPARKIGPRRTVILRDALFGVLRCATSRTQLGWALPALGIPAEVIVDGTDELHDAMVRSLAPPPRNP